MNQLALSLTPASRRKDGFGSVDAEEWINRSGKRALNQRQVLAGFVRWPMRTTKELAELIGMDRVEVARRTPELAEYFLTQVKAPPGTPKGQREFRWNPTELGKRVATAWVPFDWQAP